MWFASLTYFSHDDRNSSAVLCRCTIGHHGVFDAIGCFGDVCSRVLPRLVGGLRRHESQNFAIAICGFDNRERS